MARTDSGSHPAGAIRDHEHILLIHVDFSNIFLEFRWPLFVYVESLRRVHHIGCGADFFCPSGVHRWVNLTKLSVIVVGSALTATIFHVHATIVCVSKLGVCLKAHLRPLQFNLFVELVSKFQAIEKIGCLIWRWLRWNLAISHCFIYDYLSPRCVEKLLWLLLLRLLLLLWL